MVLQLIDFKLQAPSGKQKKHAPGTQLETVELRQHGLNSRAGRSVGMGRRMKGDLSGQFQTEQLLAMNSRGKQALLKSFFEQELAHVAYLNQTAPSTTVLAVS